MKNKLFLSLFFSSFFYPFVHAASVDASFTFHNASSSLVVSPTDNVEVWATLTLASTSPSITYDTSIPVTNGLPMPVWGGEPVSPHSPNAIEIGPFVSYEKVVPYVILNENSIFLPHFFSPHSPSSVLNYTITTNDNWITSPLTLNPGESYDFLMATLEPKEGVEVGLGNYSVIDALVGLQVVGIGDYGYAYNYYGRQDQPGFDITDYYGYMEAEVFPYGQPCSEFWPSCGFNFTVENPNSVVVPIPPAVLLFGSGLLGLLSFRKKQKIDVTML